MARRSLGENRYAVFRRVGFIVMQEGLNENDPI